MSKLAEMDGNATQKDEYEKQFQDALAKHTQLSEEARKKKEAEEAAKEQKAPAS